VIGKEKNGQKGGSKERQNPLGGMVALSGLRVSIGKLLRTGFMRRKGEDQAPNPTRKLSETQKKDPGHKRDEREHPRANVTVPSLPKNWGKRESDPRPRGLMICQKRGSSAMHQDGQTSWVREKRFLDTNVGGGRTVWARRVRAQGFAREERMGVSGRNSSKKRNNRRKNHLRKTGSLQQKREDH